MIFFEAVYAETDSYVRNKNCERLAGVINSHEVTWNNLYHEKSEELAKGTKISFEEVYKINDKIYDLEEKLLIKVNLYKDLCIKSKIPTIDLP
tara:strand:+ start:291 stop:569 length:279 start_codon:yes stop_codon:yes gene_type:complete